MKNHAISVIVLTANAGPTMLAAIGKIVSAEAMHKKGGSTR